MAYALTGCKGHAEAPQAFEAMEEGDLVFRRGDGVKSEAVLRLDREGGEYTHVGMVVRRRGRIEVLHSAPGERQEGDGGIDRIKTETPEVFFSERRAVSGELMRLRNDSDGIRRRAVSEALRLLDKGILFDKAYRLDDTTEMYCAELIWQVYARAGLDITAGRRQHIGASVYIFPSTLHNDTLFRRVWYFRREKEKIRFTE